MSESSGTLSAGDAERLTGQQGLFFASQWRLMWLKFKKRKLAILGGIVLVLLYLMALLSTPLAPYDIHKRTEYIYCQPSKIHFHDGERFYLQPFVYGWDKKSDPRSLRRIYTEDKSRKYPIRFFVRGDEYEFLGLLKADVHILGVEEGGALFLLGTDNLGRDMLSRVLVGASVSLSVGLVGVGLSFVLGCILGGVSGYYGGLIDNIIQRVVDFLLAIPSIPLWMSLSAALPADWPTLNVYFGVTIVLSFQGWCGLARVVRGKLLQLREEDFVLAARLAGASDGRVILRHLLPSFLSYLIVNITLAIPAMILGETTLSFLGLGLRPPVVSWGVLLQEAQNFRTVALHSWLLAPAFFVIATVLAFNFVGDGLRDAADPYTR